MIVYPWYVFFEEVGDLSPLTKMQKSKAIQMTRRIYSANRLSPALPHIHSTLPLVYSICDGDLL
jgi:hypothetical protein